MKPPFKHTNYGGSFCNNWKYTQIDPHGQKEGNKYTKQEKKMRKKQINLKEEGGGGV